MFRGEPGVKTHHYYSHDESLSEVEVECICGEVGYVAEWYADSYNWTCSEECANLARSRSLEGRDIEWIDKVSEGLKEYYEEHDGPMKGVDRGEEFKERMREINEGREITWADKVSKTMAQKDSTNPAQQIDVEKTGNTVRSGWEKEIDIMLFESDFEYQYESEFFDLGKYRYTPDFFVGDVVIEVKGWADERSKETAELFMQKFGDDYTYVVIGDKMKAHKHIEWENRSQLISVLGPAQ
jgi:hypothetical protein